MFTGKTWQNMVGWVTVGYCSVYGGAMSVETGQYIFFTVKLLQAAELCYFNLWYFPPDASEVPVDPMQFIADWEAAAEATLRDILSNQVSIIEYVADLRGNNAFGASARKPVSWTGNVLGNVLPPWTAWSFYKIPDNPNRVPAGAKEFSQGRVSVPGVAESQQNNGVAEAAFIPTLELFAEAIQLIPGTAPNPSMQMMMRRGPNDVTGFADKVPVLDVSYNRIGTQITRKP